MSRSDLENKINRRESLGTEQSDVTDILRSLPRVEAPANFEFAVKAKIAAAGVGPRPTLLPFMKVAAPLCLVLLVGVFAIFYATLPGEDDAVATADIAPAESSISETAEAAPQRSASPSDVAVSRAEEPIPAPIAVLTLDPKRSAAVPRKRTQAGRAREEGGGSRDSGLGSGKVITAPGIPADPRLNHSTNTSGAGDIPIRGILDILGIKADFVGGAWTVRSAAANSIAARAGIQSNDVIEAVNDQGIGKKTMLKGGFEGKTISVRREGKQVKLDLKN